jgi:pyruvate dehydrogenase E1 component beta subunit
MFSRIRKLQYSLAINEALHQLMESDNSVFVIGQGVKSPWYVGNTCRGLIEKFGPKRVIDTPVSENAITGAAVGAAIAGMKPIVVHPRMDFMLFAMDPIINQAANWYYMFGGKLNVPIVIWGIINRGGEQAAQHSQALHSIFAHIPGLKVVMPSTPYDAKGLLISAVQDPNPVVYIDDRWLYKIEGEVPENIYAVPIGKSAIRRVGKDVTIIGISYMALEALKAAEYLAESYNIDAEVIDLRTIKPLDTETILKSIRKTGRVIITDVGWKTGGVSAEVLSIISENIFNAIKTSPVRVSLPDAPAPASRVLEEVYYNDYKNIVSAVLKMFNKN